VAEDDGELEQRLGLGALPDDVRRERGEEFLGHTAGLPPPGMGGAEVGVPVAPFRSVGSPSGLNVPALSGGVQSVFDVRPINARDFTANAMLQDVGVGSTARCVYRVSPNSVFVITSVSWATIFLGNVAASDWTADIVLDLFINGIAQNIINSQPAQNFPIPAPFIGYEAQKLPQSVDEFPVFLIVGPGDLVEMRYSTSLGLAQNLTDIVMMINGTLLQSRGLPPNFEISS